MTSGSANPGGGSFFGRRKGKRLRPGRQSALARALPALLLDISKPAPDLTTLFPVPVDAMRLEIGFGGGEHFLHQAVAHPRIGFIGVEPFEAGLAKAVAAIDRESLANVRLFDQDAALLLDWLPPASLSGIDLLYPDPWPKRRHWKRRFLRAENLDRIAKSLKPGGELRFATDVQDYADWAVEEVARHGALRWPTGSQEACRAPWPDWPGTRYEAKALAAGRQPSYLSFLKEDRPGRSGSVQAGP